MLADNVINCEVGINYLFSGASDFINRLIRRNRPPVSISCLVEQKTRNSIAELTAVNHADEFFQAGNMGMMAPMEIMTLSEMEVAHFIYSH
jgi:hypothetical protein